MSEPRYLTEPMPVASVPKDKMFQWLLTLQYVQGMYEERVALWVKNDLLSPDKPHRIGDDLADMMKFLSESYSDYCDWLGMTCPFIEQHKKSYVDEESAV